MRVLFEKDFRLLLIRKSTLFVFLIIGIVFTWQFSSAMSGAYITMMGAMLALSTLSIDDMDNCMEFLFTLPCTRKQFALEKYLFVFGISYLSALMSVVIAFVACVLQGTPFTLATALEVLFTAIPIPVVTCGVMVPLELKFGTEKTRVVLLALIGIVFVVGFVLSKIPGAEGLLDSIPAAIDAMDTSILMISLVLGMVLFTAVSLLVSIKIVEKKEY